jgi:hypothetical protein
MYRKGEQSKGRKGVIFKMGWVAAETTFVPAAARVHISSTGRI